MGAPLDHISASHREPVLQLITRSSEVISNGTGHKHGARPQHPHDAEGHFGSGSHFHRKETLKTTILSELIIGTLGSLNGLRIHFQIHVSFEMFFFINLLACMQ